MQQTLGVCLTVGVALLCGAAHATESYGPKLDQARVLRLHRQALETCAADYAGQARALCQAEAKARRARMEADLRARHDAPEPVRRRAQLARADAEYEVALGWCAVLATSARSACRRQADEAWSDARAAAGERRPITSAAR